MRRSQGLHPARATRSTRHRGGSSPRSRRRHARAALPPGPLPPPGRRKSWWRAVVVVVGPRSARGARGATPSRAWLQARAAVGAAAAPRPPLHRCRYGSRRRRRLLEVLHIGGCAVLPLKCPLGGRCRGRPCCRCSRRRRTRGAFLKSPPPRLPAAAAAAAAAATRRSSDWCRQKEEAAARVNNRHQRVPLRDDSSHDVHIVH